MITLENTIQTMITNETMQVDEVIFRVDGKIHTVKSPKDNKELLLGDKTLAKYAKYLVGGALAVNGASVNLGTIYPQKGDLACDMCEGLGVVSEGEHDDIREVPCPCTIDEPADFTGATEGDR